MAPRSVVFSAPDIVAGHCQPTSPSETSGHSQASLAQSFLGSLLLSPESLCTQASICALQEDSWQAQACAWVGRISPGLWKFCKQIPLAFKVKVPRLGNLLWALELVQQHEKFFVIIVLQFVGCLLSGSMVELMATSSKRTYATCHTSQVLLQPEPLSLWQATADPFLCRRHSNTQRKVWLSLLWVLVNIRFCLSLLSVSGGYAVRF